MGSFSVIVGMLFLFLPEEAPVLPMLQQLFPVMQAKLNFKRPDDQSLPF